MVVLSNRRLGPSAELMVSAAVAGEVLREVARAAAPKASSRWEHELVAWLAQRAEAADEAPIDVGDIAWTPEHFEGQREFFLRAIERAKEDSEHARALARWAQMIEAHPRESVQVGRRWRWPISQVTA